MRASGTARWPDVTAPAPAPLTGPLVVEVGDVGQTVRAARRSGIDVSASLEGVGGPVQASFELEGTLDHAILRGRAESASLTLPTGTSGAATADLVLDTDVAEVPAFTLTTQGVEVSGDARIAWESGQLGGALTAAVTSMPDVVRPWLPEEADSFTGTASLSATIGGTSEVPDIPWQITSTPIAQAEQLIGTVSGDGRLRGTVVQVDRLRLEQGSGSADGSGQYRLRVGRVHRRGAWNRAAPGPAVRPRDAGHAGGGRAVRRQRHARRAGWRRLHTRSCPKGADSPT